MAKAARAAAAPLHRVLPDEIVIWEILVRLPPKALLRCRAVCRAWRSATCARDFLIAHHARQPAPPPPLACGLEGDGRRHYHTIITFDHRAAAAQLQPVVSSSDIFGPRASCGGLLLLSTTGDRFSVCNPATRQYAPLPLRSAFLPLGIYRHRPTGEYRILLYKEIGLLATDGHACHIFALGSAQPPRNIGSLQEAEQVRFSGVPVLFRANLHWHLNKLWYLDKYWYSPENHEGRSNIIIVFDTTTETFRKMCAPVVPDRHKLFEMDDMLGMSGFNDPGPIIDIWMMQDYETEVWTLKYRVELSNANDLHVQFGRFVDYWNVVVASCDGAVLVLVKFGKSILQFDIHGKLVSFHQNDHVLTQLRLKQTLVPHTFFPRLDGYSVNAWPFI